MNTPPRYRQLANRHVAKLLDMLEEIHDLSELAKNAIRKEFHYLADDINVYERGEANGDQIDKITGRL